jgi:hypothetical protein
MYEKQKRNRKMNVAGSSSVEKRAFINKSQRSEKVKARVDEEGGGGTGSMHADVGKLFEFVGKVRSW